MNKEDILRKSRQENQGRQDERERAVYVEATRMGFVIGGIVCVLLVLASEFLIDNPAVGLAAWMVYFSMQGSCNLLLGNKLNSRLKLVYGIVELAFAVAFAVAVVLV